MDLSTKKGKRMYGVWKRSSDGYIYATKQNGSIQHSKTDPNYLLNQFEEWPDALHFLLSRRGITTEEAHKEQNCTRCWERV